METPPHTLPTTVPILESTTIPSHTPPGPHVQRTSTIQVSVESPQSNLVSMLMRNTAQVLGAHAQSTHIHLGKPTPVQLATDSILTTSLPLIEEAAQEQTTADKEEETEQERQAVTKEDHA